MPNSFPRPVLSLWLIAVATGFFALSFPLLHASLRFFSPAAVAAVFGVLVFFLSFYDWQIRRLRRYFFVKNHLRSEGRLAGVLKGGFLLSVAALLSGVLLTLSLLFGLLASNGLLYFMLGTPLAVYLIRAGLLRLLSSSVAPDYLILLSERLTRWLALCLMTGLFTAWSFYQPQPDYQGTAWQDIVSYQLYLASANTRFIEALQAAGSIHNALFSWLIQDAVPELQSRWAAVLGWLLILAKGSLALLPAINLALLIQHNSSR